MVPELTFTTKHTAAEPKIDLVLVHGLTGDPDETWTNESDEFWPNWFVEENDNISIHTLGYPATLFTKFAKKEMDIYERAENALEYMVSKGIGLERPVVFITHSLGGLLTKQILRTAEHAQDDDWKQFFNNTAQVYFLATPHSGASLASALNLVIPRFKSEHIEDLTKGNGYLNDLNKAYRDFAPAADIDTIAYYEKFKTKNAVLVVDKESADPGVSGCRAIAIDADHISITKPKNKDAIIFCSLKRHIEKLLRKLKPEDGDHQGMTIYGEDYSEPKPEDRRDLMEKLIDAGKEHEYALANEYQNKFAQRYVRLGLHSEEKMRSDRLLGEIEQRFTTHIYHPLICKSASDEEILSALQAKVVDPICKKYEKLIDNFSSKLVMKGLYFLTEQCFIRWDPQK